MTNVRLGLADRRWRVVHRLAARQTTDTPAASTPEITLAYTTTRTLCGVTVRRTAEVLIDGMVAAATTDDSDHWTTDRPVNCFNCLTRLPAETSQATTNKGSNGE